MTLRRDGCQCERGHTGGPDDRLPDPGYNGARFNDPTFEDRRELSRQLRDPYDGGS